MSCPGEERDGEGISPVETNAERLHRVRCLAMLRFAMAIGLALQLVGVGASGALLPYCFPDTNLYPLAWVALVPLHLVVERVAPVRAFWLGWLSGTITFAGIMAWVVTAMHVYGKVPLLASYAVLILFALYLGLYTGLYAWGVARLASSQPSWLWQAAPCWWVALELARTYVLSGIPWGLLAYSQGPWLPMIQIADHTGAYGVSFLIVLGNIGIATLFRFPFRQVRERLERSRWMPPVAATLAVALSWNYGTQMLGQVPVTPTGPSWQFPSVTVGVVQGNIDQAIKWDERFRQDTIERYTRLTKAVSKNADLLVWPEAATPFVFEMEPGYQQVIGGLLRELDTPLLFGSPAVRRYSDGRPYLLNSAYLLSPVGTIVGRYDKQHLVPFGEYIPFHHSLLFFLDKLVEGIGDFEAGQEATVLPVPQRIPRPSEKSGQPAPSDKGRFGVAICYEVIFPELVRQFVTQGAEFVVTITNDAWFGRSSAAAQHFGMVAFRAVENHRAFARAANTGISGFIDPYGRVIQAGPIFTELSMIGSLPLKREQTFYTRYGDVFAYACVIIAGLSLVLARRRESSSRH